MEPYFYSIDKPLISKSCKENILRYADDEQKAFTAYQMKNGNYDGNNYLKFNFDLDKELILLSENCTLECYGMLIMHKPFSEVVKHRDGPFGRNCVLSIPIYPTVDYSATLFYDNDNNFAAKCKFNNLLPTFLNTQQTHGLKNGKHRRLNLQLCFEESFEVVVDLYKKEQLFKNFTQ